MKKTKKSSKNIFFSLLNIFKKKIIKYKFNKIISPPIKDIGCKCFLSFPSGLSKKTSFFEIASNFI